MRRVPVLLLMVVVLALVVSACAQPTPVPTPEPTKAPAATEPTAAAAEPTVAPTEPPAPELEGTISIAGSTSVQPLAEKLAKKFMEANPKVQIDVQGGGSSVGVKSAGEGTVDIGTASRAVKPEELTKYPNMKVFKICLDAVAVVVHPDNPVDGLTAAQVADIYTGAITNWKDVGGEDMEIVVVAREEGSGTRDFFQEHFLGKEKQILATAILQASNGAVREAVAEKGVGAPQKNRIGFVSVGYIDDSIKGLKLDGVEPTVENVYAGTYTAVRSFNMLTPDEPQGVVKAFLDFVLGPEGQAMVEANHYYKVQ
ncbi:MAG: phosphate ABC transporter substrate-binding protein [Anaerolineae bacterium]